MFVLMIVSGVGIFIFKDDHKKNKTENALLGNILICVSLLFDGLLGGAQDKMRQVAKPTSMNFMYYVNAWSSLLVLPMLLINFEGYRFIEFCIKHTKVIYDLMIMLAAGTVGQYFIAALISNFGSLPLSLVTTTRKFFTVLCSTLIFGNVLSYRQWLATGIIFCALLLDALFGKEELCKSRNSKRNEKEVEDEESNNTIVEKF